MRQQTQDTWRSPDMAEPGRTESFSEALESIRSTRIDLIEADLRQLRYGGDRSFEIDSRRHEFCLDAWKAACGRLSLSEDLLPQLGRGHVCPETRASLPDMRLVVLQRRRLRVGSSVVRSAPRPRVLRQRASGPGVESMRPAACAAAFSDP